MTKKRKLMWLDSWENMWTKKPIQ